MAAVSSTAGSQAWSFWPAGQFLDRNPLGLVEIALKRTPVYEACTTMMLHETHLDQLDTTGWSILGRTDSDVRQLVNKIVDSTTAEIHRHQPDRRVDKRFAYPNLITITPISDRELSQIGEPLQVVGKWLAERGLDFFHTSNLPFRRAIVSFPCPEDFHAHMILNISWSRFLKPGWYDSGGRFTHVVQLEETS